MNRPAVIQVFEHQQLGIGERGFEAKHLDALARYNEQHGDRFFTLQHRKVKFGSYVGVIQIGNLSIEVLPKADREQNHVRWHRALLTMLQRCRYIRLHSLTEADLRLRSAALIDLFFDAFLSEVELLRRLGLVKGYRQEECNQTALKGRIQFHGHLNRNLVHKERFYTLHQVYDRDIAANRILKKALQVLDEIAGNAALCMRARKLLLELEGVSDVKVDERTFVRQTFTRKTEPYRQALKLARLIILRYNPDVRSGQQHLLAILFDMNQLFEEYVFRLLKREEENWKDRALSVYAQRAHGFFQGRNIRPDIWLEYFIDGEKQKVILDTKWKELKEPKPSMQDLHQMYAYCAHLDVGRGVLLYPKINLMSQKPQKFERSEGTGKEYLCQLCFAELFDDQGICLKDAASRIMLDILDA